MNVGKKFAETQKEGKNDTKEAHIEAVWERFAAATLYSSIALQKNATITETMQFHIPEYWIPSLTVWRLSPRRENMCCPRQKL